MKKSDRIETESELANYLNQKLLTLPGIKLINPHPSPVVSLYFDKINGHELGLILAEQNIMCRTGYHCCHYYLKQKLNLPPLFRISLGLNNTKEQIDFLVDRLVIVLQTLG
jgi:selenocysteine lyase/cysteine desulfurase